MWIGAKDGRSVNVRMMDLQDTGVLVSQERQNYRLHIYIMRVDIVKESIVLCGCGHREV